MSRSRTYLALTFVIASLVPVGAAGAPDDERLHVEFRAGMPALVQTPGYGGRDSVESSAQAYAYKVMAGESVGTLLGYAVRPAPAGCDRPDRPCPDRRAALPDDRADDLPANFSVEISDEPEAGGVRQVLRGRAVYSDAPGSWVIPHAGYSPYPPYGGGTVLVMDTHVGKLRPGALAQADCFDGITLCAVRITYSRDLRVNFLTQAAGEALARQVRAVDAFMRSVIRPGPLPGPGTGTEQHREARNPRVLSYITGLPQDRAQAIARFPQ